MKEESTDAKRRFEKEAAILNTVKGHRNVGEFLQFCQEPYAIMMEYSCFDFRFLEVDKKVSSLEDFIHFIDAEFEFELCARDVVTGLHYLHSHNIAHRDLTLGNTLVSNQHYITMDGRLKCTLSAPHAKDRRSKSWNKKTKRWLVCSRVLQPALEPLSNTVSSNLTVPGTSDQSKEGRPRVCNQVWQPSFASVSSAVTSCPPVLGTFASDQNITFSPFNAPHAPIQPSHGFNVPESSHLIYNYPCQQHERQQVKENTPPTQPQRPKPTPGILVFARLAFLDRRNHTRSA